jgi:hypothetical protein
LPGSISMDRAGGHQDARLATLYFAGDERKQRRSGQGRPAPRLGAIPAVR